MRRWSDALWVVLQSAVVVMFLVACGAVEDPAGDVDTANGSGMFPPAPHKPTPIGVPPDGASAEQQQALWWVNTYRAQAGLGPVVQLAPLNEAALAHSSYLVNHVGLYGPRGLSVHHERPNTDGFFGETYWERLAKAGYTGEAFAEVVAFQPQAIIAVAHWMDSLYHRVPILHPAAKHIGYGSAHHGGHSANVLDVGTSTDVATTVAQGIPWPVPNAHGVALAWDGLEDPQPPTPPSGFPSGPVVTLGFSAGADVVLTAHSFMDVTESALDIPHVVLNPGNDEILKEYSAVALYAHDPLMPGHTYEVHFQGTRDGTAFDRSWTFVARPTSDCNPLSQNCDVGKACYSDSALQGVCYWMGSQSEGQSCQAQNDCARGLTCVKSAGQCGAYCGIGVGGPMDCSVRCESSHIVLDKGLHLGVCG